MKRACLACLFLFLTTTFLLPQSNPAPKVNRTTKSVMPPISESRADPKAQTKILDSYGNLPLAFEANRGQTDQEVKFLSRTRGYTLFLTGNEAVLALSGKKTDTRKAEIERTAHTLPSTVGALKAGGVLRMKLRNANPAAKVSGVDELAGTSNYFIGNDPAKWRTNVPTYAKVKYEGLYPGIDLVYYGNHQQLEYDFIVAPGANPRSIQFDVRGAKRIRRDEHGDLVLKMNEGEIRWHKPVVYQEKEGARQEITARYAMTDANRVGFELAKYDASRPLYIDPLVYSTYLGGSGLDSSWTIAVDSAGNAYVTGTTNSTDFPVTPGTFQTVCSNSAGCSFVTKIDHTGSSLVYSTYLGGGGAIGIAVDSSGNAYLTGGAGSDLPTTPGAFQTTCGNPTECPFVTKIDPTGSSLRYSTYLGGSGWDSGWSIAVDSSGSAYITGITESSDFPVTPGSFQTTFGGDYDAFIAKLNPTGSALVYSTYLGGSNNDGSYGIAVDSAGNAYVSGYTYSGNFPITPGAFQTVCSYGNPCLLYGDAFVTKIDPTGSSLVYSTYLGGSELDGARAIAVDSSGNAYVTGWAQSTNFPTTPGAFQTTCSPGGSSCRNAFVTKLNPTGSNLVYSTYLSGTSTGQGIAVDSTGNAYVTGQASRRFPVTSGAIQKTTTADAAFVTKFNPTGSVLVYSTLLGGSDSDSCWQTWGQSIAVDSSGNAYVTGTTCSNDFPTTPGAFQATCGGNNCANRDWDAFVTKLQMQAATTTTLSSSPNPSTYGESVTFTAVVASSIGAPPDGETVSFMKGKTVLGTGELVGGSTTFPTSTIKVGTTSVTSVYGGDSNFAGSTSKPVRQVVEK